MAQTRFAYDQGLAGAMIWAIDNDDFGAECSAIRYPLLRTINSEFKKASEEPTVVTSTTTVAPSMTTTTPDIPQKGHASSTSFIPLLYTVMVVIVSLLRN